MKRKILSLILSSLAVWTASAARVGVDYRRAVPLQASQVHNPVQGDEQTSGSLRRRTLPAAEAPVIADALRVGDELEVALFDDKTLSLKLAAQTSSPLVGASFLASTEGYGDVKNAVVIQTPDGLQIDVQDFLAQRVYTVFSSKKGVQVDEIRPTRRPQVGGVEPEVPASGRDQGAGARRVRSGTPPPILAAGSGAKVDLLLVYDQLASTWVASHGGAANFAAVTVQKMNLALANTGLDTEFCFRLVGIREVAGKGDFGVSDGSSLSAVLNSIATGSDYNGYDWSALEAMRNAAGADIVCVLTDTGFNYGVTGIGYSMEASNAAYFADYAYNCCAIRAVAEGHTLAHEVGHNMGAGHATEVADASNRGPQYDPYSSGHYFQVGLVGYHTIMAYNSDGYGNFYQPVPYFSSPSHFFSGVAVGDATHDNVRTLRNNFLAVSRFRAEASAATYAIAFDANGGTPTPAAISRDSGTPYGALPAVTRDGYLFEGWFTAPSGGTQASDTTLAMGDATLYAHWTAGAPSLGEALGVTDLILATGGDAAWFAQSTDAHDGVSAARSGAIGDNGTSVLQTEVEGPAEVSFWWRVSSEEGYDELSFLVDDVGQGTISGTGGAWVRKALLLGAGTHSLKWVYAKDESDADGADCAWVDELTVTPIVATYTISFDANGGTPAPASIARTSGTAYGTLPEVARAGYAFAGWFTAADGGVQATESTVATADATLHARWTELPPPTCTISFDAGKDVPAPAAISRAAGAAYGALPEVARGGYVFAGWFTAADGGARVTEATIAAADATLYARWTPLRLYGAAGAGIGAGETAPYLGAACVYDGLLLGDGGFAGTIQVKVAKAKEDRATGRRAAAVAATVQLAGGRKLAFKGGVADAAGAVTPMSAGGGTLSLALGVDGLSGTLGAWTIDGARNVFAGKSAADRGVSSSVLAAWRGPVNVVGADGVFTLSVGAKGKVKVSGALNTGARVAAASQLLVGREWCAIPVVPAKPAGVAFAVWLPRAGGAAQVSGLEDAVVGKAGTLSGGAVFTSGDWAFLGDVLADHGGRLLDDYLPEALSVEQAGARWLVAGGARAGKVAFARGTDEIDASKTGANPSGLKLSYKAATGSFSGSFKAYAVERGKIKAYPLTVTGVLIDGRGYGMAAGKKPERFSIPVFIY